MWWRWGDEGVLFLVCRTWRSSSSSSSSSSLSSNNNINSNSNNGTNNDNTQNPPHILVTQMALLLYLGEYTHARHLWRRHRGGNRSNSSSDIDNNNGNESSSSDCTQLEQLWNAAKYCYLWSNGGIHSLSSTRLSSPSSSDGSSDNNANNNNNNMQVENENIIDDGGNISNLPFSTLALRAFQSCQSSGMEPLSTYCAELTRVFRSRINRNLHESFDRLDRSEFRLRMNLEHDGSVEEEPVWNAFGWEKEGGYLISDADAVTDDEEEDSLLMGAEKEEDRIGKLTDIVMFLEGKMNA